MSLCRAISKESLVLYFSRRDWFGKSILNRQYRSLFKIVIIRGSYTNQNYHPSHPLTTFISLFAPGFHSTLVTLVKLSNKDRYTI